MSLHKPRRRSRVRLLALICLVLLAGCSVKQDTPATFWNQLPEQARIAATLQAQEIGGICYKVAPTGSMEPMLTGGDYIVVDTGFPFEQLKKGQPITYYASWLPEGAWPVTHSTSAKHGDGWIVDGIANREYEKGNWTVTKKNYIGKVIAIYTTRTK